MSEPEKDMRHRDLGLDLPANDRAIQQDLQRMRDDDALDRDDASAALARDIANAGITLPGLEMLKGQENHLEGAAAPAFAELENALSSPEMEGLRLDNALVAELLHDGGESKQILKSGLAFLKAGRFAQAAEWWALHRAGLDPASSRLDLLLLVMEALTHHLAGNRTEALDLARQVQAHPLFRGRGGLDHG